MTKKKKAELLRLIKSYGKAMSGTKHPSPYVNRAERSKAADYLTKIENLINNKKKNEHQPQEREDIP